MGVPDDYPLPAKYNDAYHLFGDGLAVPVVSWLSNQLLTRIAAAHQPLTAVLFPTRLPSANYSLPPRWTG